MEEIVPQSKVDNYKNELTKMYAKTLNLAPPIQIDMDKWNSFLSPIISEVIEQDYFSSIYDEDRNRPYQFHQDDNTIVITLECPEASIEITKDYISSEKLNGEWWGKILDINVVGIDDVTQINLTTECSWPVLIKGGDADGLSAYFLALIALQFKNYDWCLQWLNISSQKSCWTGQRAYVTLLFDQKQFDACLHWGCRAVIDHGDYQSCYILCLVLMHNGSTSEVQLAEFLLCRLFNYGFFDAAEPLASIYLNGGPGILPDPQRSEKLYQIAAAAGSASAMKMLERTDFSMNTQAKNDAAMANQAVEENRTPSTDVIATTNVTPSDSAKEEISDYVIAGAAVAGALFVGYRIWKRYFGAK